MKTLKVRGPYIYEGIYMFSVGFRGLNDYLTLSVLPLTYGLTLLALQNSDLGQLNAFLLD